MAGEGWRRRWTDLKRRLKEEWRKTAYEGRALRREAAEVWRARVYPALRRAAFWGQVLGGWALVTWAVSDAVPPAWRTVVWKGSAGVLLLLTVGAEMWRSLAGLGTYLLGEIDREEGEGGERRRR